MNSSFLSTAAATTISARNCSSRSIEVDSCSNRASNGGGNSNKSQYAIFSRGSDGNSNNNDNHNNNMIEVDLQDENHNISRQNDEETKENRPESMLNASSSKSNYSRIISNVVENSGKNQYRYSENDYYAIL
jgi:hypothetical protein